MRRKETSAAHYLFLSALEMNLNTATNDWKLTHSLWISEKAHGYRIPGLFGYQYPHDSGIIGFREMTFRAGSRQPTRYIMSSIVI